MPTMSPQDAVPLARMSLTHHHHYPTDLHAVIKNTGSDDPPGEPSTLLSPIPKPIPKSSSYSIIELKDEPTSHQSVLEELPRQYNTGPELEHLVANLGVKKSKNSIDKNLFLGFLAGMFVFFAGIFSVSLAGGIPAETRAQWPILPRLVFALTFPVNLVYISLFGGDLFTGNTMFMTVAYLNKKITLRVLVLNWLLSFTSNFLSILFLAYVFAFVPGLFQNEPHLSYIVGLAERKANLPPLHMFLLGIPANALVCLAIILGLAARDVTGKVFGLFLPIITFAASGWEHCVANMLFLSLGWFYGAKINFGMICINVFTVAVGNIIGGAIIVGGSEYYLYHWHPHSEPKKHERRPSRSNKVQPTGSFKWFKSTFHK